MQKLLVRSLSLSIFAQIMRLEKRGDGWRARRKKGSKTFAGPIRTTEAAAMQDAQELDAAAAVSMERLQEVHDRLTVPGVRAASDASAFAPSLPVHRIRNGWRARRKMSGKTFCGPIRGHREGCKRRCAAI